MLQFSLVQSRGIPIEQALPISKELITYGHIFLLSLSIDPQYLFITLQHNVGAYTIAGRLRSRHEGANTFSRHGSSPTGK